MVPYLVIGITALVGLLLWGLPGAIMGGLLMWALSQAIGAVAWLVDKGAIPRRVREETAAEFIDSYADLASEIYPKLSATALQKAIESEIERIARAAMEEADISQTGLEYDLLKRAGAKLIIAETNPRRRELISRLIEHLERSWYQAGQVHS